MAAAIAVLIAIGGAALALLIRLNSAAHAARGLAETADDATSLFRRWRWRRKLATDVLGDIDDPRLAATAMLVSLAQADGALTEREEAVILAETERVLGVSPQQATELLAHARWSAKDVHAPGDCFRRLTPLIQRHLSPKECGELMDMLETVAAAGGPLSSGDRYAVDQLRRSLLPR
jgi:uncharacterized tellurite resistance protein B-like protein